jgi:CRP-like cAMP-binding protein
MLSDPKAVFRKYITDRISLSDQEWAIIEPAWAVKKLRKHQYLLQEGEKWLHHGFVCEGCLRRYRLNSRGIEHIIQFSIENNWAGDRESLMEGTPTKYNIDAVEDTTLLIIHNNDFEMISRRIPAFHEMINTILQQRLNASQERIHTAISFTAEEKYRHLIETSPNLINRLPRHMLASYLGITPETLSRIRKQIAEK